MGFVDLVTNNMMVTDDAAPSQPKYETSFGSFFYSSASLKVCLYIVKRYLIGKGMYKQELVYGIVIEKLSFKKG